jgi:hypothetical protein
MVEYLLLLVPPLLVVIGMKYFCHAEITWQEAGAQALIAIILVTTVYSVSRYSQMADTEILNGQVTAKSKEWTSCSHSYSCNCRTVTSGSGPNATTSTQCDTCYEHLNDWDWTVKSTVGRFDIDRIDSRGSEEPPRWTKVAVGQPVAREHRYTNYIRGAKDSLFNEEFLKKNYRGPLPDYPSTYDYQYADRVIATPGTRVADLRGWNERLAMMLRAIGPAKQANIVMVMTHEGPGFAEALRGHWLGGKKNDIIVVVGTNYPAITWVRVFSWAQQDIINVMLRNELTESKTLDIGRTMDIIGRNVVTYYQRKPMKEFEYLANDVSPPMWVLVMALILGTGASIGAGVYFMQNECFGQKSSFGRSPFRR